MFYTHVQVRGGKILHRGYDDNGHRVHEEAPCKPYLFIGPTTKESGYKTLDGKNVTRMEFESPRDAVSFIESHRGVENQKVYGLPMFAYTFIYDNYQELEYDPVKIRVINFDIEVAADEGFPDIAEADKEVTAIAMHFRNKYIVLGCQPYSPKRDDVIYVHCTDESDLLKKFVEGLEQIDPDVFTGWNIEQFDIPYMVNRIRKILGDKWAKRLSPFGVLKDRQVYIQGREYTIYDPAGVSILDYLQLYKKFKLVMQESYSLNHIAHVELGESKLDYSEHDSLFDLYKVDWEKFIDYNIKDVELVQRLDDKLKYLEQAYAIAFDAKVNFNDVFTSVRLWDVIIHNYLMDRKIVVPQFTMVEKTRQNVGGYVKDPQIGMHEWVASFDFASLYPRTIMQYNISPETWRGKIGEAPSVDEIRDGTWKRHSKTLKEQNLSLAASGDLYDRDYMGFLPALMRRIYADRSHWKKRKLALEQEYEKETNEERKKELVNLIAQAHNMQLAKKIQLNSVYGALGNQYFRWFDLKFAESITMSGQLAIKWVEKAVNKYINEKCNTNEDYVVAIDTDSVYVKLDRLMSAGRAYMSHDPDRISGSINMLDDMCKRRIQPVINKACEELAEYLNAVGNEMDMEREALGNRAIWTGKKHYCMNLYDMEGVRFTEPKLKVMGIEAVRSSTPSSCRENIKTAIKIIMNENEQSLIAFIEKFKKEFPALPYEETAFPRGCNNLAKYYDPVVLTKPRCPPAVRGALSFNKMIKEKGLDKKHAPIHEGDKVKFHYLVMPNPSHQKVISVLNILPRELELDDFLDYNTQFEKAFLTPIRSITDAIGWECEHRSTLEAFLS